LIAPKVVVLKAAGDLVGPPLPHPTPHPLHPPLELSPSTTTTTSSVSIVANLDTPQGFASIVLVSNAANRDISPWIALSPTTGQYFAATAMKRDMWHVIPPNAICNVTNV